MLSGTLRVGYCSRCKKCLRASGRDHKETSPSPRGGPDEDAWLWMSRAIGDLLAASLSLGDPLPQVHEKPFRFFPVLETQHSIIGITHHDHIAARLLSTPCVHPQIEYVMQVEISQKR